MFWGLILKPNQRYTQLVERPFHISQAVMDISTGDNGPCQVMVVFEGKKFLFASLQKTKQIQVPVHLFFKTGDSISFLTKGKSDVHLTGYLDPVGLLEEEFDEDAEEEEEAPEDVHVSTKNKRKLDSRNDAATTKKAKQHKKAANNPPTPENSEESDDDDKNMLKKLLDGVDINTDENDESFKPNTSGDSDEEDEDSDEEEEEEDCDEEQDTSQLNGTADDSSEAKADTTLDTSKEQNQRKELAQQQGGQEKPKVTKKTEKPEKTKKDEKKAEAKTETKGDKKEKKTLSGGVVIEDLKVGSGRVAKFGNKVQVYYVGRLKTNNKMFDNCIKGPGLKFHLGYREEVITGLNVGVMGMKVGGKRKIVCPPAMAYGAKGSPPVIPPNSTLVFEVELKSVK